MNTEKEKIEKLALTVATLVGDISQKIVSSWKNELNVLKNVDIHPSAYGTLLLEAAMFGHYYVGEKFKQNMNKEEQKIFSDALNDHMILITSLLLDHQDKEKNFDGHKKMIRNMYENFAPDLHQKLSEYKGSSILDVLEARLRRIFNATDEFKIRFFENTLKNRVMLKIADLLSGDGSNNKYTNNTFLDEKIIDILANSLFAELSQLDYHHVLRSTI